MNIWTRIKKAVKRQGPPAVKAIPVYRMGYPFLNTVEGGVLWNRSRELYRAAKEVYDAFPEDWKKRLAFSPEAGNLCGRARFWQENLLPALPPERYYAAMQAIYRWYRHIKEVHR